MVFIVILVLTSPFWIDWLLYHSRMSIPEGCTASPNAQIVDVSVDPVGNSKTRRLKTVVFFSDGTQFITFKSHDTPGFLSTHMVVDKEVLAEIFEDAVTAHDKLCSGTRSQPAYSVTPPAEPKAPAPSVEFSQKFADPKSESTEPSPTIADPAAPAPATPKLRYCKHCGSPIDPATRQCTGCGKQYFRPPVLRKKHLAIAAGVLACAVFAILTFSLASRLNAAQSQISELNTEIAELKHSVQQYEHNIKSYATNESYYDKQLKAKTKRIDELLDENAMYREYLDYCEHYCAYITITGGKISSSIYHRLDCPYTEAADSLRILYIEFLESRDFTPCPYCYG